MPLATPLVREMNLHSRATSVDLKNSSVELVVRRLRDHGIRTGDIVKGWFWTDPGPYDSTRPNKSGIVNLPNKRITRPPYGLDRGSRYSDEYIP